MSCLGSFFFWSCSSMDKVVFSCYLKIICDYNQSDAKHRLIGGISWFYGCIFITLWNKPLEFDLELKVLKLLTRFQEVNGLSWSWCSFNKDFFLDIFKYSQRISGGVMQCKTLKFRIWHMRLKNPFKCINYCWIMPSNENWKKKTDNKQ